MLVSLAAQAKSPEIYAGFLSSTAVGGHDPVAYFSEGKPVAGRSDFTHHWKGATWRFASAKNRDLFKAKPEAYAPQYGGYCAPISGSPEIGVCASRQQPTCVAVSQGYTAKGDPNHWKIVDGKLFLNYDAGVQKNWEKDIPGHVTNANRNWPRVLEK